MIATAGIVVLAIVALVALVVKFGGLMPDDD